VINSKIQRLYILYYLITRIPKHNVPLTLIVSYFWLLNDTSSVAILQTFPNTALTGKVTFCPDKRIFRSTTLHSMNLEITNFFVHGSLCSINVDMPTHTF